MIAITHIPSPAIAQCQLTHIQREPIDYHRAAAQHRAYCDALAACGATVLTLDANRDHPDGVFVEDTAIELDEVAILARPGAPSRQSEPAGIELTLRLYRDIRRIESPATLEGGDVLRIGRTLLVGRSSRTNTAGIAAITDIVSTFGYRVIVVPVLDCLHLKTAVTALPDGALLVNRDWLDMTALAGFETIAVPDGEPWGANVLLVGEKVCLAAAHVQTAEMIRSRGLKVVPIEIGEFAKAEGGVTCLSILFREI